MKINWKLRLQNKTTLISLIGLFGLFINQIANVFEVDYSDVVDKLVLIATTVVSMLVAVGVVNDPTVKGLDDSDLSMEKKEPTDPNQDLTIKGKQEIDDNTEILADNTENSDSTKNAPPKSNAEEF